MLVLTKHEIEWIADAIYCKGSGYVGNFYFESTNNRITMLQLLLGTDTDFVREVSDESKEKINRIISE